MPYRRLPNTDNARIKALRAAIEKKRFYLGGNVFSVDMFHLENMLRSFEAAQIYYKKSLETQANANKKFQRQIREARLYVSHFIQVLNLCVMRNEMKSSVKKFYKLPIDNFAVPDLSSNDALLEVGENIIVGEHARLLEGGTPIYNPTIARVNVAFSIFKDAFVTQKQHQATTNRMLDELSAQRNDIDEVLRELWNQIEAFFADKPEAERLNKCREFGVVYYYRKGELEFQEEEETECK